MAPPAAAGCFPIFAAMCAGIGYSTIILAILPVMVQAQAIHSVSGTLTIEEGTRVFVTGPASWSITSNAQVINHGIIDLGTEAFLQEALGGAITGTGIEQAVREVSAPFTDLEPGGLGLSLSHGTGLGTVLLTRGHLPRLAGETAGIARWYHISTTTAANGPVALTMHYDAAELNGLDASGLRLHRYAVTDAYWQLLEGSSNVASQLISGAAPTPLDTITAFPLEATLSAPTMEEPLTLYRVWPTITTDRVHFTTTTGHAIRTMELLDMTGRLTPIQPQGGAHGGWVELGHLAAGSYVLRLNGEATFRLIKP